MDMDIEKTLEKPYWLIDIVPERISEEKGEEYALLQEYCEQHAEEIRSRFVFFLLKLNCFHDLKISHDYGETFSSLDAFPTLAVPSEIYILIDDRNLLTYDTQDTYMTLYDPDEKLLKTVEKLVRSEGLFLWEN